MGVALLLLTQGLLSDAIVKQLLVGRDTCWHCHVGWRLFPSPMTKGLFSSFFFRGRGDALRAAGRGMEDNIEEAELGRVQNREKRRLLPSVLLLLLL